MPTKLKVYTNEDDALLFWSILQPIPECRGFAIKRRIKRSKKKGDGGGLPSQPYRIRK